MKSVKEHNDNSLSIYMKEAGEYQLLTREEEKDLFKVINSRARKERKGKARERLIKSNLRLVIKIAKEYRGLGLDYEDLIEEGNIGLMTAIDKFNIEKGAKLSYYASFWIKQAIRRGISNKGRTIRLPVAVVESKLKISKYVERHEAKHMSVPSNSQISEGTGLTHKKVKLLTSLSFQSDSLNRKVSDSNSDGAGSEMQSLIEDPTSLNPSNFLLKKDNREILTSLVNKLDDRQQYIIKHRFGLDNVEPQTLETIGKEFNLTRERIRQLEMAALDNLKGMFAKLK